MPTNLHDATAAGADEVARTIALSVVVPVYNQATSIVQNVGVIQARVETGLGQDIEVIVVSDGSLDRTQERLLESELSRVRVLHYDRNLGKGYAVKTGALAARGRWVGFVDADLDIDPSGLADYMRVAARDGLDFAIASKRHPDSEVDYPRSRRVASWFFQQFVRVLFHLDVRDTQVGLKVFRREVAEQVFPLLLVKRYAFDIEMLAVGRELGFTKVRELPVRLDYRFTGSGVRPGAVVIAVLDTLAVFYRLRIARTYQRKRELAEVYTSNAEHRDPHVTVVGADESVTSGLEWPRFDFLMATTDAERREAAAAAEGELIAYLEPGATPSGNFISAAVVFLGREDVAAVVMSKMAPPDGTTRELAAAAVRESRLGGGSLYFRYIPGNIRYVSEFPSGSHVVRREPYRLLPADVPADAVVETLVAAGHHVVYTPEAFLLERPAPLFGPHLSQTYRYGRSRGARRLRPSTVLALLLFGFLALGWIASEWLWAASVALYLGAVTFNATVAGLQFRSLRVAGLAFLGHPATHAAYLAGYAVGRIRG